MLEMITSSPVIVFATDMITFGIENPISGLIGLTLFSVPIFRICRDNADRHALNKDVEYPPTLIERIRRWKHNRENPPEEPDWNAEIDPLDFQAQLAAKVKPSIDKVNAEMSAEIDKRRGR